jgi:hypothetical protein
MRVYYFFTPVYLPEINQKTNIQINFDNDRQTVTLNLSGSTAEATFRQYDGSLHQLFFDCERSPGPILSELYYNFDVKFLSECDFMGYYESEGSFENFLETKLNTYFV